MSRAVKHACIAAVAVTVASAAGIAAAATGPSPSATLKQEVKLFQANQLAKLYALYSPSFHSSCPFATFKRQAPDQRRLLAGTSVRMLRERIAGTKAYLDYALVKDGSVLATIRGDLYVKVHGAWLDELDESTSCSEGTRV